MYLIKNSVNFQYFFKSCKWTMHFLQVFYQGVNSQMKVLFSSISKWCSIWLKKIKNDDQKIKRKF